VDCLHFSALTSYFLFRLSVKNVLTYCQAQRRLSLNHKTLFTQHNKSITGSTQLRTC